MSTLENSSNDCQKQLKSSVKKVLFTVTMEESLLEAVGPEIFDLISEEMADSHSCVAGYDSHSCVAGYDSHSCVAGYDSPQHLVLALKKLFYGTYQEVLDSFKNEFSDFAYEDAMLEFLEKSDLQKP